MYGGHHSGWEIWEQTTFKNEVVEVWEMKHNLETKKFREGSFESVGDEEKWRTFKNEESLLGIGVMLRKKKPFGNEENEPMPKEPFFP